MGSLIRLGAAGKQHTQVIMTRWTVLIGAAYLVLYGGETRLEVWQELVFVSALIANLGLYAFASRSGGWDRLRWLITITDLALICTAVGISGGASNDFFLFFFLIIMVAGVSSGWGVSAAATLVMCGIYVAVMYFRVGPELWRQTELLIRLPFLYGVGLFFGAVSFEARQEEARVSHLSDVTQKMVHRYHQVASERDRTKALLEIGQLALATSNPEEVLSEITDLIQRTVRVDRCSLVVFNEGDRHAYLAACSDSDDKDVLLLLPLSHYPELQATLSTGEVTELHPDDDSALWHKVRRQLPSSTPFRSWVVVPIQQGESIVGAFFLRDSRQDFSFHEDERVFCKAAGLMTASFLQGCDLMAALRRRSRIDGLTGLLNFLTFRDELDDAVESATRAERPEPLSLVMVDLDNLKMINDRHGHLMGNEAIQLVGRHLEKALPMARAICRYGGDEFFALVPIDKVRAAERAERIIVGLEQASLEDMPCPVQVSIGVATFGEDGDTADEFMEAADRAMYLAKGDGGNRVYLADPDSSEGRLFEAVISVNARRLIPGEQRAFRRVLDELLRSEEQELDSTAVRQSLTALMEAVDSKDQYTSEHSHEVSELTTRVCEALGLDERQTLAVEMGALVHDIGKIGIPDEILGKPGKLTTRERMQIERHPEIGAQILSPLPALKDVVPLVLHHHERWDGTGYPRGLAGEDIPIGAQIISLCDVWHALTSDRSYRPAFPPEEARKIVEKGAGTEWKPGLVEIFFTVLEEIQQGQQRRSAGERRTRRMGSAEDRDSGEERAPGRPHQRLRSA